MGAQIFLILLAIWLPQAVHQLLTWLYWWQVKEYRWDRFRSAIASKSRRKDLGFISVLFKLGLLTFSFYYPLVSWLAVLTFLFLDFSFLVKILKRSVRKPVFTQRARKIMATVFFLLGLNVTVYLFGLINTALTIFIAEVLLILGLPLGISWTKKVVEKVKLQEIRKAKTRLKKVKPVVIGITGSYGKTSTKDFVASLLAVKYRVAKTEKNQNTEFGVARSIIADKERDIDIFVIELGAYREGEIKSITDFIHPSIGVITGIEPQHLELFGSLERIKKAKFELIKSLPPDGLAVFNLSNKDCRDLYLQAKKMKRKLRVRGYFLTGAVKIDSRIKPDIVAKEISTKEKGVFFKISYGRTTKKLYASISGTHFIENVSGAILIAKELGLSWKQIESGLKLLSPPSGTMNLVRGKAGLLVIDDSHNSTPKGFESALAYLKRFKGERIVITPGIIELGRETKKIHQRLGRKLALSADLVILTSADYKRYISKGMGLSARNLVVKKKMSKVMRLITKKGKRKKVVLLEGRVPSELKTLLEIET